MHEGFLGSAAPASADFALILEIAMAVGLTLGAMLARRGQYRLHACCQSTIVILNAVLIAIVMVPSFYGCVVPKIPARLGRAFYALATAHGVFGSIAELGALYLILSAGTKVLPERFRRTNLKMGMRTIFALWWLTLFLGVATYIRWYVPHAF